VAEVQKTRATPADGRKPRKLGTFIVLIGVVLTTAMTLAGTAQAAPASASIRTAAPSAAPHLVEVTVPMKIIGFDAGVAKAHGYVIRTDSHGRQYSVKAGATTGATPNTIITGDCGSSWIYYSAMGGRRVSVDTGFTVNTPAVWYWWEYWLVDNGGVSSHQYYGGLALRTRWSNTSIYGGMTPGYSYTYVDSASEAVLDNGGVCYTASPSAATNIS
jgi:hypothetical protein